MQNYEFPIWEKIFKSLHDVEDLKLSNCSLPEAPPISILSSLTTLDISDNNIDTIGPSFFHYELTELNLQGNPLKTVDIEKFPSVTLLKCGHSENWQIDYKTLKRLSVGTLEIVVPTRYQKTLEYPPHSYLSKENINKYTEEQSSET